jgi:hypothetical protein
MKDGNLPRPLASQSKQSTEKQSPGTTYLRDHFTVSKAPTPVMTSQSAEPLPEQTPPVEQSSRSATDVGSMLNIRKTPNTKTPSEVTWVSSRGAKLDYPRPPKIDDPWQTLFECPFCHQGLPIKYAKNGWRYVLTLVPPTSPKIDALTYSGL